MQPGDWLSFIGSVVGTFVSGLIAILVMIITLKDNTQKGESNEEKTVLVENSSRDSSPYIIQEKEPEIEGIVIVCEGGYDSVIKREITDAVSALFSIESHKIKIMKSKEAKE